MNRILLAAVAAFGISGAAIAQEAPDLTGNYSAAVLNAHSQGDGQTRVNGDAIVDYSATASIAAPRETGLLPGNYGSQVDFESVYSGK